MRKILLILSILSNSIFAASLVAPMMPGAEFADTEVSTNFAFSIVCPDARILSFALEIDATPSNNVDIAFGRDADGDGVLSRHEESLVVGWDCGEWKVIDCATGAETAEAGSTGTVRFDWRLRFSGNGELGELSASESGRPLFASLSASLPRFLYAADWDSAKVICRGSDPPRPILAVSKENDPLVIRIR